MADSIPDGWYAEKENGKNGTKIECYKNALGQTFYSMEDLMRYVNYAQRAKLSIYSPDYIASTAGGSRGKKKQQAIPAKSRKQAVKTAGKQRSKGGEQSNDPEAVSLPSEHSKKVRGDKNPIATCATDTQPPHA